MAVIPPLTKYVNLGPLSTAILFPASCTNTLYDLKHTYFGLDEFVPTAGCALKECCPSSKYYTEDWAWYTSYFSPGVQYRQYFLAPYPGRQWSFAALEARYGCPMQSPFYGACGSPLATPTTTLLVLDDLDHQSSISWRSYYSTKTDFQNWAVAYPIQVRMGGSPTATLSTTVQGAKDSYSSSVTTKGSTGSISEPTSVNPPSMKPSNGLSTGAIVGIAFGGFFSVALVIFVFLWLLRQHRNAPAQPPLPEAAVTYKANTQDGGMALTHQLPEIHEMFSELPPNSEFR
ncbi:uncharacterized protein BDR25DRAFT_343246 [Lindgomyces ingoldianus]|uniref:Uncharacterized protein n=1 Tax=Lindgomyces ingoldianus TaxID=673940 RepID=A0ACB6QT25_9PLEO|nr:uncharacterized protein BDR25DRAFT_343246 [Lindgomyces ingoldianus]KAF2469997.1 hypothetical protein BDR25DRAFT_343246 [Lindgomyces ingoldianus]